MLTDQERRELKEMVASQTIREEFRRLKAASRSATPRAADLDQLLNFLTTMSRFSTQPPRPRQFISYSQVRI
jgi:hypothetical protein